jgi:hypothetical protein
MERNQTALRIQALESLGFEWGYLGAAWDDRLSELVDYRKNNGHCNVPWCYSENIQLGQWVGTQRKEYRLHQEGKKSLMTPFRIQTLKSLDFEWDSHRKRGQRGNDAVPRKPRRCVRCVRWDGANALKCEGRVGNKGEKECQFFDKDGKARAATFPPVAWSTFPQSYII